MRMLHACPPACKKLHVDEDIHPVALKREKLLLKVDALVAEGLSRAKAIAFVEVPKSTCHDWRKACGKGGIRALAPKSTRPHHVRSPQWTLQDIRRVEKEREAAPWAGRACIHAILRRKHEDFSLSVSSVGRIIRKAVTARRLPPASFCEGRARSRKPRNFGGHAQRLQPGSKPAQPGDLVQIDHMTVHVDGRTFKAFRAKDPITKALHVRVCSSATAHAATTFLREVIGRMPVQSIQVDGGSEFMADFENECEQPGLPLHVLPPRRPDLNGHVERSNRALRVEFWSRYRGELTVQAVNDALQEYLHNYHHERPNQALGWLTPEQFRCSLQKAA